MPRFYFNIRDGDALIEDPDGSDLRDLDVARTEALAAAREILANRLRANRILDGQRIEITDAAGDVLATVSLKDVIRSLDT